MVFCGTPSKGCEKCRARKIRCDQLPNGCGQCAKIKVQCPGYRERGDVIFRDESSNVARKIKAKAAREARRKVPVVPTFTSRSQKLSPIWNRENEDQDLISLSDDFQGYLELVQQQQRRYNYETTPPLPISMTVPPIDDFAICFFLSNFVVRSEGMIKGHLDVITDLEWSHDIDENLLTSMKAVGLAGYSNTAQIPGLMKDAQLQYLKAIQLTNEALRDPVAAKRDSTLMSIFMLGIFETVAGCGPRSLQAWTNHVNGAAALCKLRGLEQFFSITGRRLFIQAISNLLVHCIQCSLPVPNYIMELNAIITQFVPPHMKTETAWMFLQLTIEFANFRSAKDNSDQISTMATALRLDAQALEIFATIPSVWQHRSIYTDESPEIYRGSYHVFYDIWVSQMWNMMRTLRIMLNESILRILFDGMSSNPPRFNSREHMIQFQQSTDTILQLQLDILRSVPQNIGYFPEEACEVPLDPIAKEVMSRFMRELSKGEAAHFPFVPVLGGLFLMWPLWFAGVMDSASEPVRQFVVRNLNFIGKAMGIRQACLLAGLILVGPDVETKKKGHYRLVIKNLEEGILLDGRGEKDPGLYPRKEDIEG